MNIAVACGGTGGHTVPGIATADVLRGRNHAVTLWLGGRDVESLSAGSWDGPVRRVAARGLSGGAVGRSAAVLKIAPAVLRSHRFLTLDGTEVLLAMGSYASVGPVLGAWTRGTPVVLHEANAKPGRAVMLLSRFARVVALASGHDDTSWCRTRTTVVGLPLRACFSVAACSPRPSDHSFTILVSGASQGARALNELLPAAIGMVKERGHAVRVIHLAGRGNAAAVRAAYAVRNIPHEVHGFLADIAEAYRAADLAVARAGASTCAELAACGLPALLVPYPYAAGDHQMANARALERMGGVDVVRQSQLSSERIAEYVVDCIKRPERIAGMRRAMVRAAVPDASERLADLVEKVGAREDADL